MQSLTPEQTASRDKMFSWYQVATALVFGKHTCERGWKDFSPSSSEGCADYHAVFPLLDLLGLTSSPECHKDFFGNAVWGESIKSFKRRPANRILISGLATPSMAEIVLNNIEPLQGFKHPPITKIDVLDICATPLLTCQKVFKPEELAMMRFLQQDALSYVSQEPYGLIITDAFLTRFPEEKRKKVLQNWVKMLEADGRIVTTWRIGEKQAGRGYGDKQEKENFLHLLVKQIKRWGLPLATLSELQTYLDLATKYADTMHSYSGQTVEEIEAFMRKFFGDVRIEISPPVYDVTTRNYARINASEPKKIK